MDELVSVLMCVYNTPIKYLEEAINSILDQTYRNIEYIIVDDCSTDLDVINCIHEYREKYKRITVIRNIKNEGLTRSLNIGIQACNGEYIARMDADDISFPDRIQKQVNYMTNHPEVVLVGSDVEVFNEKTNEILHYSDEDVDYDYETYRVRSLIQHSGPPHPTFLFRSSFLKDNNILYREDILKGQDYGIMVDILKNGGIIKRLREPLLRYRIHDRQISSKSEYEQKIYQSKVSSEYIKSIFDELSEIESLSIAMLGCRFDLDEIIDELKGKDLLKKNCSDIYNNIESLREPNIYITALKKLLKLNTHKKTFDDKVLKKQLCSAWWKKVIRHNKKYHDLWGINMYTLLCYRYVVM